MCGLGCGGFQTDKKSLLFVIIIKSRNKIYALSSKGKDEKEVAFTQGLCLDTPMNYGFFIWCEDFQNIGYID